MRSIQVIIPVYNAFEESLACLESVLTHLDSHTTIRVLDDCSSEGSFAAYIANKIDTTRLLLERNEQNLGFVKTCNKGMRAAGNDDVILLNSDTIVTAGWVKKLHRAAYSAEDIASVTPLSNNAIIASVPNFCVENEVPARMELEDFAKLVETVSARSYPTIPTCVGFCVYLKRSALQSAGLFDEDTFGRGYGEENDLSLRFQSHGLRDVLDDSTYIYHKGNCSFLGLRDDLSARNTKYIQKKYPHYFDTISKFCSRNPINPVQGRIVDALVELWNTPRRRVLHVVHNGPFVSRGDPLGGTEIHVADMIKGIDSIAHWSLVPGKRCYFLSAHVPGCSREYIFELAKTNLRTLFSGQYFDLVHVHHTRWLDHTEVCEALEQSENHVISFHDYTLVCPRFHLYTPFHQACTGFECQTKCGYSMEYINDCRGLTARALRKARKICCFSDSTRETVERILDEKFSWTKIAHGIPNVAATTGVTTIDNDPMEEVFRIAIIGLIPQHKGSLLLAKLFELQTLAGKRLEWHVFGRVFITLPAHVIDHGEYARDSLHQELIGTSPHLALFLSICPETYSLTLDEAWNAGIPALVTPEGAQAERVRASNAGWVLNEVSVEAVLKSLEAILENPHEYYQRRAAIKNCPLQSTEEEAAQFDGLYQSQLEVLEKSSYKSLQRYLAEFGLAAPPKQALHWRIAGRMVSILIHSLDSLGLRAWVQRAAYKYFPRKFLTTLKISR